MDKGTRVVGKDALRLLQRPQRHVTRGTGGLGGADQETFACSTAEARWRSSGCRQQIAGVEASPDAAAGES